MSSDDSIEMSKQVYDYLDKCKKEVAFQMKPSHLCSIPQFAKVNPRVMSNYIIKWKRKHSAPTDDKEMKSDIIITLSENLIEQAIIKRLTAKDVSSSDISQAISFLDKKKALTPIKQDETEVTTKFKEIQDEFFSKKVACSPETRSIESD